MILDSDTDFLFLSPWLKKWYKPFYERFILTLKENRTGLGFLPGTKDVWAVDYMPIQMADDHFIQFTYYPDYLSNDETQLKYISDPDPICRKLGIHAQKTDIILDGGNVVRSKTKVIMTSKIFKENPHYSENKLIEEIEKLLGLSLIIIPTEPDDRIGHADGMVRFLEEDTVLINDYSREKKLYYSELRMALRNANLNYIEVPYNPYQNKKEIDATGIYINYLQMKNILYLPVFGLREDDQAVRQFEELFIGSKIVPVHSKEIAKDGGVLNCISWNVKR